MRVIRCDLCGKIVTENWASVMIQKARKPVDGALSLSGLYEMCPACAEMVEGFIEHLKRGDSEDE